MMRTTVSTQPQIIIVVCCITLRRSAYDTAGNIRSITKDGTVTKSFGYTNASWPDLLTSVTSGSTTKSIQYEGQTRSDDGVVSGDPVSGNPLWYYNGKEYTFTWTKGRQLASATADGKQVSYTYDMSGVRTSKTVNGTTYNYTTLSGKVMRQQWGNKSLEFVYDDGNQPFAMIYNNGSTSTLYYYVLNAQGDVIALLDSAGALVASYNYGAWGNYSVHDKDGKKTTDATFIGHINPLRYRGYYYDRETRLYYLQSRYYDFANCRFINADTFATTDANGFLSANMFAYCENNPIMRTDETGELWNIVIGALIGVGKQFMMDVACNMIAGRALDEQFSSVGTYVAAAFSGALDAIPGGRVATTIITTALDVVGTPIISQVVDSKLSSSNSGGIKWKDVGEDVVFGTVQRVVGMGIGAKAPKTISDIKPRARRKGIKGTRNLTAYLRRKQNAFSMASNGFAGISSFLLTLRNNLKKGNGWK